jgi:hypothetical protein
MVIKTKRKKTYMFPIVTACLEESNSDTKLNAGILSETEGNLLSLKEEFSRHFLDIASSLFPLVKYSFTVDAGVPKTAQEVFIKMINNTGIKSEFSSFSETQFLVHRLSNYPTFANIALKILLLFPTTYECEKGFSSLLQIKTKHRNILNVEDDLRCALSSTFPRIKKVAAEK